MSQRVGSGTIRKFLNQSLMKMHLFAVIGFVGGVKLCDFLMYDEQPFNELREDLEDEYWAHHGKPTEIAPYITKSCKPEGTDRETWIYIMYDKDKGLKRKDEFD